MGHRCQSYSARGPWCTPSLVPRHMLPQTPAWQAAVAVLAGIPIVPCRPRLPFPHGTTPPTHICPTRCPAGAAGGRAASASTRHGGSTLRPAPVAPAAPGVQGFQGPSIDQKQMPQGHSAAFLDSTHGQSPA